MEVFKEGNVITKVLSRDLNVSTDTDSVIDLAMKYQSLLDDVQNLLVYVIFKRDGEDNKMIRPDNESLHNIWVQLDCCDLVNKEVKK